MRRDRVYFVQLLPELGHDIRGVSILRHRSRSDLLASGINREVLPTPPYKVRLAIHATGGDGEGVRHS